MELGQKVDSFVFVEMVNDVDWGYCHDEDGNEFRYDSYDAARFDEQNVIDLYNGRQLFLIKETKTVLVSIKSEGQRIITGTLGSADVLSDNFYALAVEENGGYNIITDSVNHENFEDAVIERKEQDCPEAISILHCKVMD